MTAEPLRSDTLEGLLLQAGLWEPDRALGAWKEFCEQVEDVEALHHRCYDLFPMVALNLESFAPTLAHGDYLQSTLKHSWAQSKRRLSCVLPLLAALQSEKVDFLVLKGLALSALYYKHWGSRPLKDMGLLIRGKDVERAGLIMRRMDFTLRRGVLPETGKGSFLLESETVWEHSSKIELHLQWRLGWGCCDQRAEDGAWNRAVPCPLPGLQSRTPGAMEHFFHTCVCPADLNPDDAFLKRVDTAILLRSGEIDWGYLEDFTSYFQRIEPVRETIDSLGQLNIGMPQFILTRWQEKKTSRLENLEKACRVQPMIRRWRIKHSALTYLRLNQGASVGVLCRNIWAYMNQLDDLKGILRRIALIWYVIRWNRLRNASIA
jgi:hypothetical protein